MNLKKSYNQMSNKTHTSNMYDTQLSELGLNWIENIHEKIVPLYHALNAKYINCFNAMNELILNVRRYPNFQYNEEIIIEEIEQDIIKIRYDFKNWVNANINNLTVGPLQEAIQICSNKLNIVFNKINVVKAKLIVFINESNGNVVSQDKGKPKKQNLIFKIIFISVIVVIFGLLLTASLLAMKYGWYLF